MTKEFFKALLTRTVKTWCQAFVAVVGIDTMKSLGEINWLYALSVASTAAIICFVWNLGAGLPEVKLAETLYALDNEPYDEEEEGEDDGDIE